MMATRLSAYHKTIPSVNRLALWGDVGCGKDTWAATLQYAAENAGLALRPFDEATAKWQADVRARMALGYFPRATDVPKSDDELRLLTFELSSRSSSTLLRRQKRLLVQIPQAAGGWWTDPHTYRRLHIDSPDPYHYLAYASGIICLVDPTAIDYAESASSLMTMIDYLDVYRRRHKQRYPIRIAFWLTKMDHPQHRRQKSCEEAYAHTLFGSRLANFLYKYSLFGDYEFRWGGCSAVGTVFHQGRMRSNTYWDYSLLDRNGNPLPVQRILDPQSLQPEEVLEPLRWVMEPVVHRATVVSTIFDSFLHVIK